jgi:hypothetical protein
MPMCRTRLGDLGPLVVKPKVAWKMGFSCSQTVTPEPDVMDEKARKGSNSAKCDGVTDGGNSIGGVAAIDLPDRNRVHFEPIERLISFGRRWRADADAGLIALGHIPPSAGDAGST